MGTGAGAVKGKPCNEAENGEGSAPQSRAHLLGAGSGSPHSRSPGESTARKPSQVTLNRVPAKPAGKAEAADQRSSGRVEWEWEILLPDAIVLLARNMKNRGRLRGFVDSESRQKSALKGEPRPGHCDSDE